MQNSLSPTYSDLYFKNYNITIYYYKCHNVSCCFQPFVNKLVLGLKEYNCSEKGK